jgi:hypothetical protein
MQLTKATIIMTALFISALVYVPHVLANICVSSNNGYTVNGAPATKEEHQKCYNDGVAAMSNSSGNSSTVVVSNPKVHTAPQITQPEPVINTVTITATPPVAPPTQINRIYKPLKPAGGQTKSTIPSQTVTPKLSVIPKLKKVSVSPTPSEVKKLR